MEHKNMLSNKKIFWGLASLGIVLLNLHANDASMKSINNTVCSLNQKNKTSMVQPFIKLVNELFLCIINDVPFDNSWDMHWGEADKKFFYELIPPNIIKYQSTISFAGEFVRFLRKKIVDDGSIGHVANVYLLPRETYNSDLRTTNSIKRVNYEDLPIAEALVRITIFKRKDNGKRNRVWGIQKYYYVAGTVLKNGMISLELREFLSNAALPLEAKGGLLDNISASTVQEFQNWLISQEKRYENMVSNRRGQEDSSKL